MSTIRVEGNVRFRKELLKDDEKLLADIFTQTDHSPGIKFFDVFDWTDGMNVNCWEHTYFPKLRGAINGEFTVNDSMGKLDKKFADRWLKPLIKKEIIAGCKLYVETSEFEDWSYSFVYKSREKRFAGYSEEDEEFRDETAIILAGDEELTSELWLRGWDVRSE